MSDEHDSWFKTAFGVDLGEAAGRIKEQASATLDDARSKVTQVVQGVQGTVEGALDGITGAAAGVVKKVAGAVSPSGSSSGAGASGSAGGGTGSFPLGGSVGRGGKNAPGDVRAVQAALGIAADGKCGGGTIAAIEAFQRNMGQGKADGRVDAGGGTERALAGGMKPPPATRDGDDSGSLLGRFPTGAAGLVSTNAGILETAEATLIAAGEITGVSGAVRKVEAAASGAVKTAEQAESIAADDPFSTAIGFGFGAVSGVAPGGFLLPSPKPESKAFELGRGVGLIAGGIAAVAVGGGEEVIGTGLDVTGIGAVVGVPVNVLGAVTIASGVASAGVGIATVGGVLSTGGGGGGGGGEKPPDSGTGGAVFEKPVSDHATKVGAAEKKVAILETNLVEETQTVTNDEAMLDALEAQKRSGGFDPKIGAFEGQVKKDFDLLRLSATDAKDVKNVQAEVAALESQNAGLAKDIEIAVVEDQSLSTQKADDSLRQVSGLSKRLSALSARTPIAQDEAISLQVRIQKLGERLKKL